METKPVKKIIGKNWSISYFNSWEWADVARTTAKNDPRNNVSLRFEHGQYVVEVTR